MSKKIKYKIEAENGEIIQSNQPLKIKRGGMALPLGGGYSLLKGRKHSQGGIDIDLQGDARVWSSVPFLRGLSPAERVLDGENPDKVFVQQENWKERYGVKDDGSKARFGGEDENWRTPLVYKDSTNNENIDYIGLSSNIKNLKKKSVSNELANSRIFLDRESRNGLNRINRSIEKLYIDPEDNLVYGDDYLLTPHVIELAGLKEINKDSAIIANRKNLDYIGGNKQKSRKLFYDKIKQADNIITNIANDYNIDQNLLKHRLAKEGVIDYYINIYNDGLNKYEQKDIDSYFLSTNTNGFHHFGLDDAGTLLKQGKIKLKHDINWWDNYGQNEKGRKVNYATGETTYDNIVLKAATLKYIQDELLKRKNIPKDKINIYTNAAYNLGLYHEDLNNNEWVEKNYAVPKYTENKKQMGGNINKNGLIYNLNGNVIQGLGYVPSTGRKKDEIITRPKKNFGAWIKKNASDLTNFGINTLGSIGSYLINKNMLFDLKQPTMPIPKQAVKFKTNYNINPQLDNIKEQEAKLIQDINNNTSSSNVALARINRARFANMLNTNTLYGNKENIETQLINQDRANQQQINNTNIDTYNQYLQNKIDFENKQREAESENAVSLLSNLGQGLQDIIARREQRAQDKINQRLQLISAPNAANIGRNVLNMTDEEFDDYLKNNKRDGMIGNDGKFYTSEEIRKMSHVQRKKLFDI